ncbi:unnamed protein product [Closterium sp. Naga37s-1]|nr:unnamed protein product [Closterium sp. Naga37s-1]
MALGSDDLSLTLVTPLSPIFSSSSAPFPGHKEGAAVGSGQGRVEAHSPLCFLLPSSFHSSRILDAREGRCSEWAPSASAAGLWAMMPDRAAPFLLPLVQQQCQQQ